MAKKQKICILNYNLGNIFNISKTLKKLETDYKIINTFKEISSFDKYILPGVGNFDACMKILKKKGFYDLIKNENEKGKIIFGICLGMQIFFNKSDESKSQKGLELIRGEVKHIRNFFNKEVMLPHIGWSKVYFKKNKKLNNHYYFANSYVCETSFKNVDSYFKFEKKKFIASIKKDNLIGTQFHPEISSDQGFQIYKRFLDL